MIDISVNVWAFCIEDPSLIENYEKAKQKIYAAIPKQREKMVAKMTKARQEYNKHRSRGGTMKWNEFQREFK